MNSDDNNQTKDSRMNKEMHGMLIWAPLLNHRQRAGCVSISTILKDRRKKKKVLLL